MNLIAPIVGVAAAGLAWALGKKKKSAAEAAAEVTVTPEGDTKATGEVVIPSGAVLPGGPMPAPTNYQKTPDEWAATAKEWTQEVAKGDTVVTSPGLPPLPTIGTGPTSGATSVNSSGVLNDAFDQLLATALAKNDLSQLEALAKQAELAGLKDVAESIRAEIARIKGTAPVPTPAVSPTTAPVSTYLGRATISMRAGSRGPDVVEWQRLIGVKQDGIFGPITDSATRAWQKAHPPLVVDGIVGPKTWAAAYAVKPSLATTPRPVVSPTVTAPTPAPAPILTSTSTQYPTIKQGSRGEAVKTWQRLMKVTVDGIFGPITDRATRDFQRAQKLVVDGIVGPKTWGAALAAASVASTPVVTPVATTTTVTAPSPIESDMRIAARELTTYLQSIGGLAGRYKEDRNKVKGWQSRLLLTADGSYGRNTARAVILQGLVPVVPYYWPSTGTATAKAEFTALVKQYASSDPLRKAEWDKLLADIPRS